MDGVQRIAMVETKTWTGGVQIPVPVPMYRYQLGNHLGSSMLEVDETGLVISYEEYTPYGASAYQAARSTVDVSARRYRYTGKERDEETGLYYNGARYLAAWLGRWTSADPIGIGADGPGLYNYTRGSPVNYTDPSGTEGSPPPAGRVWREDDHPPMSGTFNPPEQSGMPDPRTGAMATAVPHVRQDWEDPNSKNLPLGDPFADWLLKGDESSIRGTLTNDSNLKALQDAFTVLAVGALAVASGGLLLELAAGGSAAGAAGGGASLLGRGGLAILSGATQRYGPGALEAATEGGFTPALPGLGTAVGNEVRGATGGRGGAEEVGQGILGLGKGLWQSLSTGGGPSKGELFEAGVQRTFGSKVIRKNEVLKDATGNVLGEIDFETKEAIVEVGTSLGGKLPQLHKLAAEAASRGKRLDVVYGPDTHPQTVRDFQQSLAKKFGNRVRFIPHE